MGLLQRTNRLRPSPRLDHRIGASCKGSVSDKSPYHSLSQLVSNTGMPSSLSSLTLAALSTMAVAQNAATPHWQSIDQLCGQIELSHPKQKHIVVDGKPEVRLYTALLEGATLTLYPEAATEHECCTAKAIATTRSNKFGAFKFDGVQSGAYWLRVEKNKLVHLIPVRVTDNFDAKQCSLPEVSRAFVVDSSPPKVQKRIR